MVQTIDILNHLNITHGCDGQTDRQTHSEHMPHFTTLHGQKVFR